MNRFLIARSALELFGCDYQENAFESTPVTWESQEPRHGLGTRAYAFTRAPTVYQSLLQASSNYKQIEVRKA